ncbi:hypothetical protein UY3_12382 [Chelonia mydas]|uniref:Uncharacterized protein n=1 Tax=Chelonia mydas TaxID=8469 RepID=M7BED9_CHEMY|nr:hypothetical protein UY3_12382 [Chelonia mydas]
MKPAESSVLVKGKEHQRHKKGRSDGARFLWKRLRSETGSFHTAEFFSIVPLLRNQGREVNDAAFVGYSPLHRMHAVENTVGRFYIHREHETMGVTMHTITTVISEYGKGGSWYRKQSFQHLPLPPGEFSGHLKPKSGPFVLIEWGKELDQK